MSRLAIPVRHKTLWSTGDVRFWADLDLEIRDSTGNSGWGCWQRWCGGLASPSDESVRVPAGRFAKPSSGNEQVVAGLFVGCFQFEGDGAVVGEPERQRR